MVHRFIDFLRYEKRYSERTVSIYSKVIDQFLEHAGIDGSDEQALSTITSRQIRAWMADLLRQENSTRTINLKLTAVNRFCKLLLQEKVLIKNPVQPIQRPKTSKRLPAFFEETALNDFLSNRPESDEYIDQRDHFIIELLYVTGIRRAELIALRPCDIYFSEKVLRVHGKGDKQREIPFTEALFEKLHYFLNVRQCEFPSLTNNDSLFVNAKGKPLYPYAVNRLVHDRLKNQRGFTGKKSPHVFRHSLATHLLNNGADIMSIKEVLGHENLAATQVYTHNSFKKLKNVYKKAHPRAN